MMYPSAFWQKSRQAHCSWIHQGSAEVAKFHPLWTSNSVGQPFHLRLAENPQKEAEARSD